MATSLAPRFTRSEGLHDVPEGVKHVMRYRKLCKGISLVSPQLSGDAILIFLPLQQAPISKRS